MLIKKRNYYPFLFLLSQITNLFFQDPGGGDALKRATVTWTQTALTRLSASPPLDPSCANKSNSVYGLCFMCVQYIVLQLIVYIYVYMYMLYVICSICFHQHESRFSFNVNILKNQFTFWEKLQILSKSKMVL